MKCLTVLLVALLLAPLAAATAADDENLARIVTQTAKPAECLAPVAILQIDRRPVSVSPQGFTLEPGHHTMNGRALVNVDNCPVARGLENKAVPPLEADFEAGKTYYVGFDHSSKNRAEWHLVIWKTEPSADES